MHTEHGYNVSAFGEVLKGTNVKWRTEKFRMWNLECGRRSVSLYPYKAAYSVSVQVSTKENDISGTPNF